MSAGDVPGVRARILGAVTLTFLAYATVGLPLAVLPTLVVKDLGFGAPVAGLLIGTQYLATLLSRAQVGRITDQYGAKRAVAWGFATSLASGVLTLLAASVPSPALTLGLLFASRLGLGVAESWVSTGAIAWALGLIGGPHIVRIIAWNGIASYGALSIGAPVGVALQGVAGLAGIGVATCLLAAAGLALTLAKPALPVIAEARLPMRNVVARVLPYGCIVALASTGFGAIAAFVTLYFESRHWQGASLCLTLFGLGFIAWRALLSGTITRLGGLRTSLLFFVVEIAGLLVLCLAPTPAVAMAGAGLAGFGFSPIFPALGSVAVGRVPPQSRGAAIGLYTVFLDVSLGITGPLAGLLIERFGTTAPFWLALVACCAGTALTASMLTR